MVIIPYNTDAPIYHYPVVTGGLIVTNVGLFLGVEFGSLGPVDNWMLHFGSGLHPREWLSCIFMHFGVAHLIGNMMFLWVFGLISEGKLGAWRFLICYLVIGVFSAAVEQTLLLTYDGPIFGGAGASGAIFGLMGMALIWAPRNHIECLFGYWIYVIRTGMCDISVATLSGVFLSLNVLCFLLHQQLASSEAAHLLGAVIGFGLSIFMLKTGRVDCEGWDLFSVWHGEPGHSAKKTTAAVATQRAKRRRARQIQQAPRLIEFFVQHGNLEKACETYRQFREDIDIETIARRAQLAIVKHLLAQDQIADAMPLLEDLAKRDPRGSHRVRLKLAELLLTHEQRPRKALEILHRSPDSFPHKLRPIRRRLITQAQTMCQAGVLELGDE